ncbi:MAG: LysM peptidoglycan-binding domain-containing protein [Nitrospirae bacterium]|nr:LysM peptidoglycan-binding domain-containing protein [Nitrospirota bacterium]
MSRFARYARYACVALALTLLSGCASASGRVGVQAPVAQPAATVAADAAREARLAELERFFVFSGNDIRPVVAARPVVYRPPAAAAPDFEPVATPAAPVGEASAVVAGAPLHGTPPETGAGAVSEANVTEVAEVVVAEASAPVGEASAAVAGAPLHGTPPETGAGAVSEARTDVADVAVVSEAVVVEAESAILAAPEPHAHTVESGDTLWDLARAYLGSGARWTEIAAANPSLGDPHRIFPGQQLTIPPAASALS